MLKRNLNVRNRPLREKRKENCVHCAHKQTSDLHYPCYVDAKHISLFHHYNQQHHVTRGNPQAILI